MNKIVQGAFAFAISFLLSVASANAQPLPANTLPAYQLAQLGIDECAQQLLETVVTASSVTYIVSDVAATGCKGKLRALGPHLPPGVFTVSAKFRSGANASSGSGETYTVQAAPPTITAYTLFHPPTSTHFMTASEGDRNALLAQGWTVADAGFNVWPSAGPAPSASKPVCRLYFPAKMTHFYSASEKDCNTLRATSGFVDEGTAFRALVPFGGRCGPGTRPAYRLFNTVRVNHRYTSSTDTAASMVETFTDLFFAGSQQSTWTDDGIAFCSPTS